MTKGYDGLPGTQTRYVSKSRRVSHSRSLPTFKTLSNNTRLDDRTGGRQGTCSSIGLQKHRSCAFWHPSNNPVIPKITLRASMIHIQNGWFLLSFVFFLPQQMFTHSLIVCYGCKCISVGLVSTEITVTVLFHFFFLF